MNNDKTLGRRSEYPLDRSRGVRYECAYECGAWTHTIQRISAQLDARRVTPNGGAPETQLELSITHHYAKRSQQAAATMTLPPHEARTLAFHMCPELAEAMNALREAHNQLATLQREGAAKHWTAERTNMVSAAELKAYNALKEVV